MTVDQLRRERVNCEKRLQFAVDNVHFGNFSKSRGRDAGTDRWPRGNLLTFERQWTDEASGRTLPKFVTEELHGYMSCGILGRGFAHLYCAGCREHHVVAADSRFKRRFALAEMHPQ